VVAGHIYFDECDLLIATRFAVLASHGMEVRHVQGLKRTVDRQIDLLNDLTGTLRRRAAIDKINVDDEVMSAALELHALRSALLDRALRHYIGT
jgi:hypothetical protein